MTIRGLINNTPAMRRHPLTGKPIEPLGIVGNKVVWPIMGGAPDGDDDDEAKAKAEADAEAKAKEEADAKAKAEEDGSNKGSGSLSIEELAEQLEKTNARMKAADKRADAAEAKIKEAERAELDEVTRLKADLEDRDKKIEELTGANAGLRLNTAFITANKVTWHDSDTALALAQSGGYMEGVMDDEGEINKKALGSALDRLAKEKPYLVKSEKDEDGTPGSPSGQPAGGRSENGKDDAARKQTLKKRFPVLNR